MIESLNAVHISENLADYEAARSGFFTLLVGNGETFNAENADTWNSINGLPSPYADKEAMAASGDNNQQKILALNVVKAFVPHFSLEVLEYKRGNEKVKFAGTPSYESGSLTVDDVVGIDTKNILLAWQAQAYRGKSAHRRCEP